MRISIMGTRRAACVDRNETLKDASCAMRSQQVDRVVVTEPANDAFAVPVGILSANDIVTRAVALGLDCSVITVGDLLWAPAVQASMGDTVAEALHRLTAAGAEAAPVVDSDGKFMGVVSLDDLLQALAGSESSGTHRLHR